MIETGAGRASFDRGRCPSPISPAIRRKIISPTGSPKTSPPNSRASTTVSSSPATPLSPTRASRSTPRRSARSLASATCSKARYSATRTACVSTRSSSTPNPARIFGPSGSRRTSADLFKLQDEIVARLANTLGYELIKAEAAKGTRSTNPDANDLVMRGWALINDPALFASKEKVNAARALFEQALAIDPNNAAAIAGDAATYFREYLFRWGNSGTDYDAKILGQADRAIALAPDYDQPYMFKSLYLLNSRRFDEAVSAADAGLAVNPNNPYLYLARAAPEIALGRFDEAKSDLQQGIRLSPRDPFMSDFSHRARRHRNWRWPSRSRDRRIPKVARRRRSHLLGLCKPRRLLCAPGQDGRGEAVRRRNPSRQSELHHQMV